MKNLADIKKRIMSNQKDVVDLCERIEGDKGLVFEINKNISEVKTMVTSVDSKAQCYLE